MTVRFVKMHGAGNDFVMIDDRVGELPCRKGALVARIASRPDGIGCEGVIFVQESRRADFRMRFFNPDGSEAELCGNGARCVAAFARAIGAARADKMVFETKAGKIAAEIIDGQTVKIAMPMPKAVGRDFANTGVPHAVVVVDDLNDCDVAGMGRKIRYSKRFAPAGTNVDFVLYDKPSRAFIRTYERGVEAETFACGTGSVAAAVVGVAAHGMKFPVTVETCGGYKLTVDGTFVGGRFSNVTLAGPVKMVFQGSIDL